MATPLPVRPGGRVMPFAFPYLLAPAALAAANRARRRQKGDVPRLLLFSAVALVVTAGIFGVVFWLTWQLLDYEELGDYLIRLGLSWLFLTFLSFLSFSAVVTSLSTFFLSDDLMLLLAAPIPRHRLFYSRFVRTAGQSSWMVVIFMGPILLAVGLARCAGMGYYLTAIATLVPFVLIPVALGSLTTLLLVNTFPARRARDLLMLMGLLFAGALVMMLRFLRPERLLSVQSIPDVTAFFATLQSPITPLLPSFWAGETLFAGLVGGFDSLHFGALWTTALAFTVLTRSAFERHYFRGFSKAQEARKARFTRLRFLERGLGRLPLRAAARELLVKDLKVFLRDTTQWSQLLLLLALVLVYLYNFKVLDLERIPYFSRFVKNLYAFVNLAMAAFVLSAVAVRFVFPAVSAEGPAFWVVRSAPIRMRSFLWSKFWTGLLPILLLAEVLTIVANRLLGVPVFLQVLGAVAILFWSFAIVGLATGMGAQHPRFNAENLTQVAGSYGGVSFMVLAVLFILVEVGLLVWPSSVFLWHQYRGLPIPGSRQLLMGTCFGVALALSLVTFWVPMRRGERALEELGL
jgi:ABC-2 type transport system permease protein